jgi:drug/metabolite transporter (DMT)-like permease
VAATLGRAAFTGRLLLTGQAIAPIDPRILSQSRTTISFLVLLPFLAWRLGWGRLRLPLGDAWRVFALGVLGIAASNFFYYLAIQRTNVATAIVLQYTAPIWVLLYAILRRTHKPTPHHAAAVAMAVAGIALVVNPFASLEFGLDGLGVAAALISAFAFAFYNIAGHGILARHDHWRVLLYTTCSAALFWVVINPPWKIASVHYSGQQWLFLMVFSLVSVLGPFAFYFAGLQYLEPTHAVVASCLEPVFAILIAAVALSEVIGLLQSAGIALVLVAIVVVQLPSREAPRAATIIEPIE